MACYSCGKKGEVECFECNTDWCKDCYERVYYKDGKFTGEICGMCGAEL